MMKSLLSRKSKVVLALLLVLLLILTAGCADKPKETVNTAPPQQEEPKESPSKSEPGNDANEFLKLLTVEEVEKIGNFKEVKLVDKDPTKGAGGELNFAVGDNLIIIVQVQGGSSYSSWKASQFYKEDLSGLGDEAFWGSSGITDGINGLAFLSGDKGISITAFYDMGNNFKVYFDQDQLLEVANLILSRL